MYNIHFADICIYHLSLHFFNVKNKSGCAGYCCIAFYLVVASRGCSLVAVHEFLIVVTSTVVEHRLQGMQASVIMALGSRA